MLSNDSKDSIHLFLVVFAVPFFESDLQDNAIESMKEAWVDFTAGWASGAMAVLTCQPIDTVLTRYQAGIMAQGVTVEQTRGLVNAFGLQSLWRGSSAMISAVPLQNALLMGGYGMGKQWSEKNKQESNLTSVFVGGTCGGIVQSFLMAPVELMKVNQQITVNKTARQAGEELFSGLFLLGTNSSWRGLNATLLRDGIPHGVWFGSYEWCKNILNNENFGDVNEKIAVPLISGAVAAIVAWVSYIWCRI